MLKKLLVVLTSMIFLFTACGEKAETKKVKEELVIAQDGEAKSLDIHQGNDGFSLRANRLIYSRLVESDENMQIHPGLAESWEQIDDKTMQFHLRKGVKFHNGYDLTAEDIKFSFERMMNSPRIAFVLPPIEKIEIVDDYTVNLVTKTPFGPLLAHLSHPALGIVSKKLLTENPEALKETPIGTGSYKFKEWVYGDRIVLEKNEDFYDKNEKGLKYIVFKNVIEASNRAIGLETGEIDIAIAISSVDEENIKNNLLTEGTFLNDEPQTLLRIELREPSVYNSILEAISNGCNKIREIADRIHEEKSKCSKYMLTLQTLRLIEKCVPCTEPETSKKGIYEITDNYYKFWYRFLFTNQNCYSMLGLELSCEETSVYSI